MSDRDLFGADVTPAPEYQHAGPGQALQLFAPAPAPIPGQLDIAAELEPATDQGASPSGRLTTRERRGRKAERLRDWAGGRETKADAAYAGVQAITSRIPLGQPILVGHHSERGARADVRRIESGMDRFCEHNAKAAEMRSRAANIEAQAATAIYSDDPDAVERLRAKVAKLEEQRETIKARNAEYKREHRAELAALPSAFARDRAMPFPGYVLKNLSADIRRNRKRLEELETPEQPRTITARYDGTCDDCGADIVRGDQARYWKRSKRIACTSC